MQANAGGNVFEKYFLGKYKKRLVVSGVRIWVSDPKNLVAFATRFFYPMRKHWYIITP